MLAHTHNCQFPPYFPIGFYSHAECQIWMLILLFPYIHIINPDIGKHSIQNWIDIHYVWIWFQKLLMLLLLSLLDWIWMFVRNSLNLIDWCQSVSQMITSQSKWSRCQRLWQHKDMISSKQYCCCWCGRRCKAFWLNWLKFHFQLRSRKCIGLLAGDHDQIITKQAQTIRFVCMQKKVANLA